MKVIQALAWYFPDSTGGTEVYVSGLADELQTLGVSSSIVAAREGAQSLDYVHNGMVVHRYPFAAGDLLATRGDRPPPSFPSFVDWLERQPRGIYHQHSWTTSCGFHHLTAAKSLGFKTVLTVHVPGNICLRGTMMEFGKSPCDGRVEEERCGSCRSQARGLPQGAARFIGRIPQPLSRMAYRSGVSSRFVTALAMRELTAERRRQIGAMADAADRVVAVCAWLWDALRRNYVPQGKLVLSRQGVGRDFVDCNVGGQLATRRDKKKLRLGYTGRSDPVKGLALLLDVMDRLSHDSPVELIIYAIANTAEEKRYREALVARAMGDSRVKFLPPVSHSELPAVLVDFDLLVVPSQWMETGPLVVLEAQAVGVPILGSDLGGVAELVTPGVDGHLVPFSDPSAWADAIRDAIAGKLPCLSQPRAPRSVRSMADVARDMAILYGSLT